MLSDGCDIQLLASGLHSYGRPPGGGGTLGAAMGSTSGFCFFVNFETIRDHRLVFFSSFDFAIGIHLLSFQFFELIFLEITFLFAAVSSFIVSSALDQIWRTLR